ncbi:MAG: hypothetical protein R8G66_30305 [Cytophagales bacterium]|nr:hypothetical protein [Cytophagales bacterium]
MINHRRHFARFHVFILLLLITLLSGCEYSTTQKYKLPLIQNANAGYSMYGAEVGPITTFPEDTRGDLIKRIVIRHPGEVAPTSIVFVPPIANNIGCGALWHQTVNNTIFNPNPQFEFTMNQVGSGFEYVYDFDLSGPESCITKNPWDGLWRLNVNYPISLATEQRTVRYVEIEIIWEPQ